MEQIFGKRKWTSRMEELMESQKQQDEKEKTESEDTPGEE
jgi:hypothetical protein